MKLSIVTTLYQSSPYICEFYQRISCAAKKITDDYEIIFVNDGSPDDSINVVKSMQHQDDKIVIVDLSRNFGHHCAIMTGLSHAEGEYIFLLDCDLEEDPELLSAFWHELHGEKDIDVVYGVQKKRKGKMIERYSGALFFKLLNTLSDIKITENLVLARLMTKRYVSHLLRYKEREIAFVGIAALAGFNQRTFMVDKKHKGSTTYNFKQKINLAINFITSLTSRPLVYIFNLGIIVTLFSICGIVYLLIKKLLFGIHVDGWVSIVISIWFFGGVIIFCLGIIGIYLSKIFIEVKGRPYSIVKAVYSSKYSLKKTTDATLPLKNLLE